MNQLLRIGRSVSKRKIILLTSIWLLLGTVSIGLHFYDGRGIEWSQYSIQGFVFWGLGALWFFESKRWKEKKRYCFEFQDSGLKFWKAKKPENFVSVPFSEIIETHEDSDFLRFSTLDEEEISIRKDLIPESIYTKIKTSTNEAAREATR